MPESLCMYWFCLFHRSLPTFSYFTSFLIFPHTERAFSCGLPLVRCNLLFPLGFKLVLFTWFVYMTLFVVASCCTQGNEEHTNRWMTSPHCFSYYLETFSWKYIANWRLFLRRLFKYGHCKSFLTALCDMPSYSLWFPYQRRDFQSTSHLQRWWRKQTWRRTRVMIV